MSDKQIFQKANDHLALQTVEEPSIGTCSSNAETRNCLHDDDFDIGINVMTHVEVSLNQKCKRVHMGLAECSDYANSKEGALPLVCPSLNKKGDIKKVVPNKRRKFDGVLRDCSQSSHIKEGPKHLHAAHVHEFVSASEMFNSSKIPDSFNTERNIAVNLKNNVMQRNKRKKSVKQIPNQSSILSYFKPISYVPEIAESNLNDSNMNGNNICRKKQQSSLYPAIRKVENTQNICISDSNPHQNPCSSQKDVKTSEFSCSVVKKPFDAQKSIDLQANHKERNTKDTIAPFVIKTEEERIKDEPSEYTERINNLHINEYFQSFEEFDNSTIKYSKKEAKEHISDKFGLLGTGSYPKQQEHKSINYFEMLPVEIIKNIFCQLPMSDLCLNINRVCLRWNQIIANEKFLPWKKFYYRLNANEGSSRHDVQQIMNESGMTCRANYLVALIRYMKNFRPSTAANMNHCLARHAKYQLAKALIDERLQDCCADGTPNAWSVIAILVMIAHNVQDMQEIIWCLFISTSQCTSVDILECLYCIASFLYAFKLAKNNDVWNGMHYRLFYTLYLYENASTSTICDLQDVMTSSKGQQSLVKYSCVTDSVRLTREQLRIVNHQAGPYEIIKIVAFAGAGKTTTLVKYTQLRPDEKFLLVVYNKSVCEYAKTKFPRNVECRTGHSLAFSSFGNRYKHKLFGIEVYTLTQALPPRKSENLFIRAKLVMTVIENFLVSADFCISLHHVPDVRQSGSNGLLEQIDLGSKQLYVTDAQYIWNKMQDLQNKMVGMSHDGYLKLYQMSKPTLSGYDCILIDEAQDLTPATTDILLRQHQGKILVGDPHQQIYSFRGATNAMNAIDANIVFYLTQSFRFGPEIAQVAMSCLEVLKKENKKILVGINKTSSILGAPVGQVAIISRCNFTVFSEAVKMCCHSNKQIKVAFVGGTTKFGFPMLKDIYTLLQSEQDRLKGGLEIQNNFVKTFKSFTELEKFATKSMDNELLGKIKIVKTFHPSLLNYMQTIDSICVNDIKQADYVFSTAHKAKGLEFSTVRITDDFLLPQKTVPSTFVDFQGMEFELVNQPIAQSYGEMESDEKNLLYVAVTRAKNALQMSNTLLKVLRQTGMKFEFPVLNEHLKAARTSFTCFQTGAPFTPNCVTLERKTIVLGDDSVVSGGLLSPAFLSHGLGGFSSLLGLMGETSVQKKEI